MAQKRPDPGRLKTCVLTWYDQNKRTLPWRAPSGVTPNPYDVWLSEIMLQQTTVATVIPYFLMFKKKWPTLKSFAHASLDEVFHCWQGLGYYQRARNLKKCAEIILELHGGIFPSDYKTLLSLPGIGPYTAGAICSIAFNRCELVMDGNIERVMSRVLKFEGTFPKDKKEFGGKILPYFSQDRPGDFVQALMDLGASVCRSATPTCVVCPLKEHCEAFQKNCVQFYPKKTPKPPKKTLFATIFWVQDPKTGNVYIQKRPETGLLAGLMEFPSSSWQEKLVQKKPETLWVTHTFTHFHLNLSVQVVEALPSSFEGGVWVPLEALDSYAFPTVMKKVKNAVLDKQKVK